MPPILFIHGMWSRPSTFNTLRAELKAAGIDSAAPALPLHDIAPGAPPPPAIADLTLDDYVSSLAPIVARLSPAPVIAGHSMGGLVAQLLAARVGAPGLILLSTAPTKATGAITLDAARSVWPIMRRWGWWRSPTLLDAASARWSVFNTVPEAEATPCIAELTWDSGRVMAETARGVPLNYTRLSMPALVLCGTQDRITPEAISRNTARALTQAGNPRVDYEQLPAAPHWLFHDAVRPRVAAAISRFMSTL